MTRDSSPPEAPLCSGSAGAPGCAASLISMSSAPCGPGSPSGVTATVSLACGIASAVSSALTSSANLSAASFLAADSSPASCPTSAARRRLLVRQAGDPVVVALQLGQPGACLLGPRKHRRQRRRPTAAARRELPRSGLGLAGAAAPAGSPALAGAGGSAPYSRIRRPSVARRSCTAASRTGSASTDCA